MRLEIHQHVLVSAIALALGAAVPATAQSALYENFDTQPGVGCTLGGGGAGTYPYPSGWLKFNVDNRTPAAEVAYVNEAWEVREDFSEDVSNCVAFSTSWYSPVGAADDWTWTPAIQVPTGGALSWRARAYDPQFRDGYQVRVLTGGPPTLANQASSSVVFQTAAEETTWQPRTVDLSSYSGQTVYVGFRNNSIDKFLLVIDDVSVSEMTTNLVAATPANSSEYPRVTSGQSVASILGVLAVNQGNTLLTNVNATATIRHNGVAVGTPLLSTPIAALGAGVSLPAVFPIGYTFNGDGSWTIEYQLTANETGSETSTLDNVIVSNATLIGADDFARHEGAPSGSLGIGAKNGGELGSQFEIAEPASFGGIRFALGAVAAPGPGQPAWEGQTVVANLRGWDGATNTPGGIIATTEGVTSTLQGGVYDVTFENGPQTLSPGTYVVTVVEPTGGAAMPLFNHDQRFTTSTLWVTWPTIPGDTWMNVETFGTSFAKSLSISLLSEFPLFKDGFDGTDPARSPAPAKAVTGPLRKSPPTQLVAPAQN